MPRHNKTAKEHYDGQGDEPILVGLNDFKKCLERHFFARPQIDCKLDKDGVTINVTVTLQCNYSLFDSLNYINNGSWGGFVNGKQETSKFEQSIQQLSEKNSEPFDIVELYINLSDTSLIISKIAPGSIRNHMGAILKAISTNFVHYTKGTTEKPFEIFIPVFPEDTEMTDSKKADHSKVKRPIKKEYFDYWGIYYESNADKDPAIFDVKSKTIDKADFFFLDY